MNRIFKKMAALAVLMLAVMIASGALAQDVGVIVQTSCNIVPAGDYYLVHCFAQVHNNSEVIICLDEGVFQLSSDGELIVEEEISSLWPSMLAPGADGYFYDVVRLESEGGVPAVTGLHYNVQYMTMDSAYAGQELEAEAAVEIDEEGGVSVACRITNPTEADAYDPMISLGLYTAAGQMIYAHGTSLGDVGIPAGGSMLWRMDVDETLSEQWQSYGAAPDQVRVSATIRGQMD